VRAQRPEASANWPVRRPGPSGRSNWGPWYTADASLPTTADAFKAGRCISSRLSISPTISDSGDNRNYLHKSGQSAQMIDTVNGKKSPNICDMPFSFKPNNLSEIEGE
jgi:hypothetical protein